MKKRLQSLLLVLLLTAPAVAGAEGASRPTAAEAISPLSCRQGTAGSCETECREGLRLGFDTRGLEVITPGHEYMLDGMVYFSLEKMAPVSNNRDNVLHRIKSREGHDLRLLALTPSEEHSLLLSYPAWLVVYDKGENEDSRHCMDIYVHTDTADFRLHTSVPVDFATAYHDEIGSRLATVAVKEQPLTQSTGA